ncbi:MAG: TfoX/Sxy family protein [Verrucomicrobia bacterium]|nr:TfoX/Sxy family protein [Verrucomicrobiota bacterium]
MAHDEQLAERFRKALGKKAGVSEKKMMGGLCFLLNGNMVGGADRTKQGLGRFLFRLGKDNEAEALSRPGAYIMEQGGKRMGGFVFVNEDDCSDKDLRGWIDLTLGFVGKLPPK